MKMRRKSQLVALFVAGMFISTGLNAENYKFEGSNSDKSEKAVTAGCVPATGSTEIDLNNVRALIWTGGDMWWDQQNSARYEVPKGSGHHALFNGTIWIGGEDVNGQLRLCAQRYRSGGVDYWTGPLIVSGAEKASVSPEVCLEYDHHFVVTRDEVTKFRSWYNADQETRESDFEGYTIPKSIMEWPAHGDASAGYDYYLAPFKDVNGDGYYNYNDGDYPYYDLDQELPCGTTREARVPRLFGDKTLWWVYNDKGNAHTESGGAAIGMEIRAQYFAFATNDELNNMTFGNYALINRSSYTLLNTYFGVWTDADLGYAYDDFVGCDVQRGLGYMYNGEEVDGDGEPNAYGEQPPAVGIDFFEGPYQDPNGIDDMHSYDTFPDGSRTNNLKMPCDVNIMNGNINGLNFGDGIVDNERWGMRRFVYHNNAAGAMGDPGIASEYYNYLRGYWADGKRMRYGKDGYNSDGPETDFMFPGKPTTDVCGWGTAGEIQTNPWSEETENNTPNDRRFVQSAGPFTLEPGAVNDITVGAVWARATKGGPWASVEEVRRADDKAQLLFENCFKVVDGPDAPELTAIPLDKEIIFQIWNKPRSNNYQEKYKERDPFISCPVDQTTGVIMDCDKNYVFQGYQVFQLKNETVSVTDIRDPDFSRLVFQCDVKDNVTQLVNYEWSDDLNASIPSEMVNGNNKGVSHTFRLTDDMFAEGDRRLVNNKRYYYLAIAYAFNEYAPYNQNNPDTYQGQKKPYLAGRKAAEGSIRAIEVIPTKIDMMNNGTALNSYYGEGLEITRIEGMGNGDNFLDLTEESVDEIMSGPPWKIDHPKYKGGYGPIDVHVVDPLNVVEANFILRFDSVITDAEYGNYFIKSSKWYAYKASDPVKTVKVIDKIVGADTTYRDSVTVWPSSVVYSDSTIMFNNTQLIPEWGLGIRIVQVDVPVKADRFYTEINSEQINYFIEDNGFIDATVEFENEDDIWLYGVFDSDNQDAADWIAAGSAEDANNPQYNDQLITRTYGTVYADEYEVFENVLNGTWTPYYFCAEDDYSADSRLYGFAYKGSTAGISFLKYRIPSVDIVITKDRSKWSRCVVVEMCVNDTTPEDGDNAFMAGPSQGGVLKFDLRASASIDKDGKFAATDAVSSSNENDASYVSPVSMGWFPGYAINVETGERLNIIYGEDSWLGKDNGRDMMWNPTGRWYDNLGTPIFGGKHAIYVMDHTMYFNKYHNVNGKQYMPAYDGGEFIYDMLRETGSIRGEKFSMSWNSRKRYVWQSAVWASIPMTARNFNFTSYDSIPCDVTVKLRMANTYWKSINDHMTRVDTSINVSTLPTRKKWDLYEYDTNTDGTFEITKIYHDSLSKNSNYPMYMFSTVGLGASSNVAQVAEDALDLIRVVPNPYYGHNGYETSQIDMRVKFTNLPENCIISIYAVNGTLIKKIVKDNDLTWLDWNLKNEYGITVSSGVYIMHINAPGIGEKIIKWFGVLRPMDLNNF